MFADGAGNVAAWCDGDTVANATLQATIGKVTLSLHCVITPTGDYGLALNRTMDGVNWNKLADVALCVAPEVHELPLAAGWRKFDATCRYYKTQESVVIVSIAARTTQSFQVSAALATLPEGFRPAADLEVPAIFKGSRRLVTIKATADGNLFVDLTDQSGVAITSDDYFFATFAFVAA